jgi:hypothetical protein
LDLLPWVRIHFQDDNSVEFSGYLHRIGYMIRFRELFCGIVRGVTLEQKPAALSESTLRCSGKVIHADFGIRPDGYGDKRALVRVAQKHHCAFDAPEHSALKGKPTPAESICTARSCKLPPKVTLGISSVSLNRSVGGPKPEILLFMARGVSFHTCAGSICPLF